MLLGLLILSSSLSGIYYSTGAESPAHIDQTLFVATVPPEMTLGKSYTVQVLVVNNSTQYISGSVVLDYPQYYFFTDQPTQNFQLSPGDSQYFYYPFVASNPHSGGLNVSALLFINVGSKLVLEQSVSVTVYSIVHSPLVAEIWIYLILGLVVAGGGIFFILILRKSRDRMRAPS